MPSLSPSTDADSLSLPCLSPISIDIQTQSQIGSGDRSERIRTYNFQQGRVTDHRCGLTLHSLDQVLAGGEELEEFYERLDRMRVLEFLETDDDGEE